MARERMVTRTIESFNHTVIGIDKNDMKTVKTLIVTTGIMSDKDVEKSCRTACENENLLFTAIVNTEKSEKLYGMTENEFMQFARELPPRGATE